MPGGVNCRPQLLGARDYAATAGSAPGMNWVIDVRFSRQGERQGNSGRTCSGSVKPLLRILQVCEALVGQLHGYGRTLPVYCIYREELTPSRW